MDKTVYKVGENHAKDIQHLLNGEDLGFEVKTRAEYMEETGIVGGDVPTVDRPPGTTQGGADAIEQGPKGEKVRNIRGALE